VRWSARKTTFLCAAAALTFVAVIALVFLFSHRWRSVTLDGPADRVVVVKHAHTLTLYRQGQVLKTYRVALGRGGLGPKVQTDDNRVPEGVYRIVGRNPHSAFHRALRVGYPTPEQIRRAQARGVVPGGDIMVHGIRNGLGSTSASILTVQTTSTTTAVLAHPSNLTPWGLSRASAMEAC
jgi:murein L,D-transpeptidase YafK